MWFCVNEVIYPVGGDRAIVAVKSTRRFKPPRWATSLVKTRSASEVVRLSELGVVLKGEGREYIEQYFGKWMKKGEFLRMMKCALYRSYKSTRTVERMMSALREFANKPVSPKPRPRRSQTAIYELPPSYPTKLVALKAKRILTIPYYYYTYVTIPYYYHIYVFSKTVHIAPDYTENRATIVIPLNEEFNSVEITEKGVNTLRDLLTVYDKLEENYPDIANKIKLIIAFTKLTS